MLPVHQNKALEMLNKGSESYNIVRARYEGRKMSEMLETDLIRLTSEIVLDGIKTMGHYKVAENKLDVSEHITTSILKVILIKHKFLTIEELALIVHYGAHRKFQVKGDLDAVNSVNIIRWITAYKNDEFVKNSISAFHKNLSITEVKEITPDEQNKIIAQSSYLAWQEFNLNGTLPLFGSHVVYKFFKEKNNIIWTEEKKTEMSTQAEENVYNFYKSKLNSKNIKKFEFENLISELSSSKKLYMEKCKIALRCYFTEMKSQNKSI